MNSSNTATHFIALSTRCSHNQQLLSIPDSRCSSVFQIPAPDSRCFSPIVDTYMLTALIFMGHNQEEGYLSSFSHN